MSNFVCCCNSVCLVVILHARSFLIILRNDFVIVIRDKVGVSCVGSSRLRNSIASLSGISKGIERECLSFLQLHIQVGCWSGCVLKVLSSFLWLIIRDERGACFFNVVNVLEVKKASVVCTVTIVLCVRDNAWSLICGW